MYQKKKRENTVKETAKYIEERGWQAADRLSPFALVVSAPVLSGLSWRSIALAKPADGQSPCLPPFPPSSQQKQTWASSPAKGTACRETPATRPSPAQGSLVLPPWRPPLPELAPGLFAPRQAVERAINHLLYLFCPSRLFVANQSGTPRSLSSRAATWPTARQTALPREKLYIARANTAS